MNTRFGWRAYAAIPIHTRMQASRIHTKEVERPVRRGSRPFDRMKGPELVEGLDPKPLNVRATDPKRVEVNSLHLRQSAPLSLCRGGLHQWHRWSVLFALILPFVARAHTADTSYCRVEIGRAEV